MPRKLTPQQQEEAISRYLANEPGTSIAEDFGVTGTAIYSFLKRRGIKVRTSAENWIPRKLPEMYCSECGITIPNRKDRNGTKCLVCQRKQRCEVCGQLVGAQEHVCNGIDVRGSRYCIDCSRELRTDNSERWHPYCTTCQGKRSTIKERETRKELRKQFGDKCQNCGYNRCAAALHFHHVYSDEKRRFRSDGRVSTREIKLHPERFKLLCANCHFEEHHEVMSKEEEA